MSKKRTIAKKAARPNRRWPYTIIVGSRTKTIQVQGLSAAIAKAWEISETTDAVVRVVKVVAKFKSGARLKRKPSRRKK